MPFTCTFVLYTNWLVKLLVQFHQHFLHSFEASKGSFFISQFALLVYCLERKEINKVGFKNVDEIKVGVGVGW